MDAMRDELQRMKEVEREEESALQSQMEMAKEEIQRRGNTRQERNRDAVAQVYTYVHTHLPIARHVMGRCVCVCVRACVQVCVCVRSYICFCRTCCLCWMRRR